MKTTLLLRLHPHPPPAAAPSGANQQQIDNLYVLASDAFGACNNSEAEGYCNKIIELDIENYKAWLLKGKAIGWQSTYGSPRVVEGAKAMRRAVDYAPEAEKESVAFEALFAIKAICNALCSLAKDNFSGNPTKENRFKFGEFLDVCTKATDVFDDVSATVKDYSYKQWKEHKLENATYMNNAGVAATKFVREKWNEIDHPNNNSFTTYLDWFGEIDCIFMDSIKFGSSVGETEDALITRYKNRIIALEEPINAHSQKQEWQSWSSSYVWVTDRTLTDGAKASRRKNVKECQDAIRNLEEKKKEKQEAERKAAEQARKKRIEDYWEEHKEEKEKLEAEKQELEAKIRELDNKIDGLVVEINKIKSEGDVKSALELEIDTLYGKIRELNIRKSSLGLFAGKEKKQIAAEISELEGQVADKKAAAEAERKAKDAETDAKIAPFEAQKKELKDEITGLKTRIGAIKNELTKDRD